MTGNQAYLKGQWKLTALFTMYLDFVTVHMFQASWEGCAQKPGISVILITNKLWSFTIKWHTSCNVNPLNP